MLTAGILLYILGSIGCANAGGFASFLGWRVLEALGAASGLVIGRAIIADTCDKKASAKVYSIVYPLVSLSPAIAPRSADIWRRGSGGGAISCSSPRLASSRSCSFSCF